MTSLPLRTGAPPQPRPPLELPRRVLVVEDNPADAYLTADCLRESDPRMECDVVARLGDVTPARLAGADCVLVDLSLPDAEGLEAVVRLRRLHAGVPVVVLTGDDDVETAAAALQHGAQDYLVKSRADGYALARAIRYARERKRLEAALAHQALHDPLTGLGNRTLFRDRLEHALERVRRHGSLAVVLFCDLDAFKSVNDTLGHSAGDELLVAVSRRLRAVLREEDTLARLGGDEFTVLSEDLHGPADVQRLAARVHDAVTAPVELVADGARRTVQVGVSTGIALVRAQDDPETLLRDADIALYEAKQAGRGRSAWFDDALHADVVRRVTLQAELRQAVTARALQVAYQPVVDIGTGRAVGHEALVRWSHPGRGVLPASAFLPVAEQTDLVDAIDRLVLDRVAEDLGTRRRAGAPVLPVSVNVSGRSLADPDLAARVLRALARTGAQPQDLVLEIVESAVVDAGVAARLGDLRAAGVRVALDDFGAGTSSLTQLLTLSVDALKLDGSLLAGGGETGERARALLQLLVGLGEQLGLSVVAEGVESEQQRQLLLDLGVRLGQGTLWGGPALAR